MKVYTSLITFAVAGKDVVVLVDGDDILPTWIVPNEDKETLDIVRDGFYNISGISKTFMPTFKQAGTFEFWLINHKAIYIIYSIYFPSSFELQNLSYRWKKISDLDKKSQLYSVIRYLYINKGVYVQ